MLIAGPHNNDTPLFLEIAIVVILTLVNGLLAMSELAVVSSRPARLGVLIDQGNKGAAMARKLADDPGKFLSSVQIGITLVGILSGAFSGATLGIRLSEWLRDVGLASGAADIVGVGIVVVSITYLSLIMGELVPKQIALRSPELVASRIAPLMAFIATIAAPLVFLLDVSGKTVLRLLGQSGRSVSTVTEEEIRTILAEATSAGVLDTDEQSMITGVMRLADRSARGLMTPRLDVDVIDLNADQAEIRKTILGTSHSRLPVQDGDADSITGVLHVKSVLNVFAADRDVDFRRYVQPAPVVMDHTSALDVLRAIRQSNVHLVLVFDEYGHFEGIVTSGDILEAITGVVSEMGDAEDEPALVEREDGSWLVAGWMHVDELRERLAVPVPRDAKFETVAGYVLSLINRLPKVGEIIEAGGWRIEVVDLDGRRIDKVLLSRIEDG